MRVEQAVAELADDYFSPVYLRNATAYGVSRRLRADIVVNNLVGHAVTTGKVLLQSDGSPWRPLVHIRDIIAAFNACLAAPIGVDPQPGVQRGQDRRELHNPPGRRIVRDVVPDCELAFADGASADTRNYRVDFTKISTQLPGFTASWTLRDGIEELSGIYRRRPHRGRVEGLALLPAADGERPAGAWAHRRVAAPDLGLAALPGAIRGGQG